MRFFARREPVKGIAPDDTISAERAHVRRAFVKAWIPADAVGAELGVYKGHFSKILLDVARPRELHLVDPWFNLTNEWGWGEGNNSTIDALINILRYFKPEIEAGTVRIHVGDDLDVLERFDDGSLDWVYIDSSHAYAHTLAELEVLKRKVRPAGVIAGDDWRPDPNAKHHGVYRAVQQFNAENDYEVVHTGAYGQWAIRRRGEA